VFGIREKRAINLAIKTGKPLETLAVLEDGGSHAFRTFSSLRRVAHTGVAIRLPFWPSSA